MEFLVTLELFSQFDSELEAKKFGNHIQTLIAKEATKEGILVGIYQTVAPLNSEEDNE
jgi:hypothetical protein